MNNLNNICELISFKSTAAQNAEGEAIIKIQNKQIRCFLDNIQTDLFLKVKPLGKIKCKLTLMVLKINLSKNKKKVVVSLWNSPATNNYKINGEVVQKSKEKFIIDCGFMIEVNEKFNAKISTYVQAEGRIDLKLMEE